MLQPQGRRRSRRREDKVITKKAEVPEELVLEILSKLPVRSLLRFKCVSKRWSFLISDPKFNVSGQRQGVIILSGRHRLDFSFHCINDDGSVDEIPMQKPLDIVGSVRIKGSCNGLLLLNQGDDLFICNPLTRFCNKVHLPEQLRNLQRYTMVPGLCYDSSIDDYKLVIWIRHSDICMVGSFRNKLYWTEIHSPCSTEILPGPIVNEHLHWLITAKSRLGEDRSSPAHLIVYFVPQTSEFVKVPMPGCDRTRKQIAILGFGVLNGCLSLALFTKNDEHWGTEVLVMNKYGDKESWTSLFLISKLPDLYRTCGLVPLCRIKDIVLLLQRGSTVDVILAYNLNKRSLWNLPIPRTCVYMDAAMIVESLVLPPSHYR